MEKLESQPFRDGLAEELKQAPKEERNDVLDKAKENPEYWQARTEKIKERQNEEEIDGGLGVLVKRKTLYHGSGTSGIKEFNAAENDTVGSGIYFTSEAKDAIGYARRRARSAKDGSPVIYESAVENMKILDLRKLENVRKVMEGFKQVLFEKLKEPDLKWNYEEVLKRAVKSINEGKINSGNLREVTFSTGDLFTDYVKSLGYDGLATMEGGEGNDIGDHDTYLLFDPNKVKINKEHGIL